MMVFALYLTTYRKFVRGRLGSEEKKLAVKNRSGELAFTILTVYPGIRPL